jgi:UDP-glucose 4-epimerase
MKRVLITGVSGFIGRALAESYLGSGSSVYGVASLSESAAPAGLSDLVRLTLPDGELRKKLGSWQPDLVFHCAGSALPARSLSDPAGDFVAAVPVMQQLLEGLRIEAPGAHLVALSSAAVYGQPERLPVSETDAIHPLSPYGYHKWMGELLCQEYSGIYGLRTTCARVFSAYGPGLRKQILWDAISKLRGNDGAVFFGTGAETRDFIYIDDLVAALRLLGDRPDEAPHLACNVASGRETRIDEAVAAVAEGLGIASGSWRFSGEVAPGAPSCWRADISWLERLGFVPAVAFDEGVRRTVAAALGEPGSQA